ncbi:hypothetical protein [uncultured Pontibacter sp.]|uniref:hypothetical protein n=1 Tax=uncultured Pontibacter sp. TaxID=453356 RepID=UPI0026287444|nr:hypothetical protein [uncultured Pontibacter sp.]
MLAYKTAKGPALFIYIAAPVFILLGLFCLYVPFMVGQANPLPLVIILWPMAIGFIVFLSIGLLDTIKGRIIVHEDRIQVIKTLSDRSLQFDEIKGYRIAQGYLYVESTIPDKKRLKFSSSIGNSDAFYTWLTNSFPHLDDVEIIEESQEILTNAHYGRTVEEREATFNAARKKAKVLNWTGGLACAWALFWPEPYEYAILTAIAIPLITLITIKFSDGLFRLNENKESTYPSVSLAMFAPSFALGLRGLLDFNIFEYSNVWILMSILSGILFAIFFYRNQEFNFRRAKGYVATSSIAIVLLCYSYGAVIMLNCFYDTSESQQYTATVVNKRISTGKNTSYYLELTKWGNQVKNDEVSVTEEFYNQFENGDEVTVYFQKGQFDIPWFFLTE